jgi:transcription antitermination factor NusG
MTEHTASLYRTLENGSKTQLDRPLFSSYAFVRIRHDDHVKVLDVPGVLSVVGAKHSQPTPSENVKIEAHRASVDPQRAKSHPLHYVGQRARDRVGALAARTGIAVRKKNSLRVVLTLELLMHSIGVEGNGIDLEALDPDCTAKVDRLKHSAFR